MLVFKSWTHKKLISTRMLFRLSTINRITRIVNFSGVLPSCNSINSEKFVRKFLLLFMMFHVVKCNYFTIMINPALIVI
jgi:hypothetical protein